MKEWAMKPHMNNVLQVAPKGLCTCEYTIK